MSISGAAANNIYNRIIINGAADLQGSLTVSLDNYVPQAGELFDLIDWDSLVQDFDNNNVTLPNGMERVNVNGVFRIQASQNP